MTDEMTNLRALTRGLAPTSYTTTRDTTLSGAYPSARQIKVTLVRLRA